VRQKEAYEAEERRLLSVVRAWTASARGASEAPRGGWEAGERMWGGRRCRLREKSGEGKTVRALTRTLVVGSWTRRCGLNWYLWGGREREVVVSLEVGVGGRGW